jgi:hypothetical protein
MIQAVCTSAAAGAFTPWVIPGDPLDIHPVGTQAALFLCFFSPSWHLKAFKNKTSHLSVSQPSAGAPFFRCTLPTGPLADPSSNLPAAVFCACLLFTPRPTQTPSPTLGRAADPLAPRRHTLAPPRRRPGNKNYSPAQAERGRGGRGGGVDAGGSVRAGRRAAGGPAPAHQSSGPPRACARAWHAFCPAFAARRGPLARSRFFETNPLTHTFCPTSTQRIEACASPLPPALFAAARA